MHIRHLICTAVAVLSTTSALAQELVITDAWVRSLPPVQKVTAGYLSITNAGWDPVEIVGGTAELATKVEIHRTVEVNGMMRMEPVPALKSASGDVANLEPGGAHLMLLGLERMPLPGERIEVCVTTAAGDSTCAQALVRREAPGDHDHSHH